jgi:hypothetical protein
MASSIFKNELYCRLSTLGAHYQRLLLRPFPTQGSSSLAQLVNRIVQGILTRYGVYTEPQLKLISSLCDKFEEWCGDLSETQVHQPPWGG